MEFEDNKNAMYCDPNAYILSNKKQQTKKVVFQEPYECLPNRYLNNNFNKHGCDFCCKPKPKQRPKCDCEKENCKSQNPNSSFPFDVKDFFPLLSGIGGVNNSGIGNIISMLGNVGIGGNNSGSGFDVSKVLSSLMSNGGGNLLNGLFKKRDKKEHNIKSTDIPIKNYTRVE